MDRKRLLLPVVVVSAIFLLSACKLGKVNTTEQVTTEAMPELTAAQSVIATEGTVAALTTEAYVPQSSQFANPEVSKPVTTNTPVTEAADNPESWSTQRIVEEYKAAASKSDAGAKSSMKITLVDIDVNNGEYDKAMSVVKPIISKFIESSSTENDGITGGFESLVAGDVSSARAYKSGNNTIIEMTMVEQTSGPKEDANSGSVGHAITAVGDIDTVVKSLTDMGLPLELSEKDTKIYYTSPTVRVEIDPDGKIVSGTWSYRVEICMDNMTAFGQRVEKASITMDNTITV